MFYGMGAGSTFEAAVCCLLFSSSLLLVLHSGAAQGPGPHLRLQPQVARPGDPVLVTVTGVERLPEGQLGSQRLEFFAAGGGYQALLALSVDEPPGVVPLEVRLAPSAPPLFQNLTVLPDNFRVRQLTVSKRFTAPSRRDRQRAARDKAAFADAFDRKAEGWLFDGAFSWPRFAEVTAPFGDRRQLNGKKLSQHLGVDLDGRKGDPVYASNAGEVVLVRDCFVSGKSLLLHHGGRLFSAYFHLAAFDVNQGDRVQRGALIGRVGSTGRVTGPHLHWGVKVDSKWVNPESLLELDFHSIKESQLQSIQSEKQ